MVIIVIGVVLFQHFRKSDGPKKLIKWWRYNQKKRKDSTKKKRSLFIWKI